ncbi:MULTISPECIES: AI-2E family transporter [Aequorivita]|uniref:AI-2E family transporter n=1 Tax=Aequorivita soesokkakensis TaxID=1385699 RepID=A0A1A9LGD2_9FLAO|nr:AI-2E family transporter [Aequorivita soesokkakensis]OAD92449.1 AI-2E family transporter [Aequorivita soesokkakensis]
MKATANAITIGILRALAVIAGIFILLWFLFDIQALILYIGLALVLSLVGRPVVLFLRRRLRLGNTFASVVTLLLIMGTFGLLLSIFVPIIIEQGKHISQIDFEQVKRDLNELNVQASDYLGVDHFQLVEAIKRTSYVQNLDVEIIPSFIDIFFGNIGSTIVGLFSVLFISFFLLKDEYLIARSVLAFSKRGDEEKFKRILIKVKELLSRYFIGLLFQISILALFYSVLLLFLDIKDAVAVAIICAFLNIVPYLGPLIGWILMLLVIVSNNLGADFSSGLLPPLLWASGYYALAQLFDNLISQPVIFGHSVRSHPLEIFIVILIGGFVFGIPGMILAVPTYTTLKVIAKEFLSEYKVVQRLTKNM